MKLNEIHYALKDSSNSLVLGDDKTLNGLWSSKEKAKAYKNKEVRACSIAVGHYQITAKDNPRLVNEIFKRHLSTWQKRLEVCKSYKVVRVKIVEVE
jgi:arginyl-tRNA--protein-N-Asp/Glu arginylyltransferase